VGLKEIVPPLQGSGVDGDFAHPGLRSAMVIGGASAWALLFRPVGAHLPILSAAERETDYARTRVKTLFSFSQGSQIRWGGRRWLTEEAGPTSAEGPSRG
jgi:hypothetical protein